MISEVTGRPGGVHTQRVSGEGRASVADVSSGKGAGEGGQKT